MSDSQKPSQFEAIAKFQGLKVPPGQELPHLLNQVSEQGHRIEHLFETSQLLVDHLAVLTERLVNIQMEIRQGAQTQRTAIDALTSAVFDLTTQQQHIRNSVDALRTRQGVLPAPNFTAPQPSTEAPHGSVDR